MDDGPLQYTIEQVHPMGTNSLLAASYKTGKTTLLANLLKAMADGVPFLGELNIMRACHVAYWNYELTRQQFRVWLRRIGVRHPENAAVWNLRGYRLPLGVSSVEDLAVEWLLERDIDALILDPFTKAYGGNENDNSAITEWTDALDVIKQRANVQDLFLAAHFGRAPQEEGAERARGGTRIDDWPDARWILTKQAGIRYFSAEGRDVAYIERSLSFDPQTYRLYLEGGSRAQERDDRQLLADVADVVAACQHEPGITTGDLEKHVSGNKQRKSRAIREAIARGEVRTDKSGKQTHHYVKERTE